MDLKKLRNTYLDKGYSLLSASAKTSHDIILNKIFKSNMSNNITIKGGVVMYNLSNNIRRATRDLDIDFIKYSISDESLNIFIKSLNDIDDGINIIIDGDIEELHHQDYNGKRLNLILKDQNDFTISTKLDVGVHKLFDVKQEEYCFKFESTNESAILMINSKEQIIAEKIKSLLRFGIRCTRYKDVFDIYYLIENTNVNKKELKKILKLIIISDEKMKESNYKDINEHLKITLEDKLFKIKLFDAKNNWLNIDTDIVISGIIDYFYSL